MDFLDGHSVSQPVSQIQSCQTASRSVSWLFGWSVSQSVRQSVDQSVSQQTCLACAGTQLIGQSVIWPHHVRLLDGWSECTARQNTVCIVTLFYFM